MMCSKAQTEFKVKKNTKQTLKKELSNYRLKILANKCIFLRTAKLEVRRYIDKNQ